MARRSADAWGEGDAFVSGPGERAAEPAGPSGRRGWVALPPTSNPPNILREVLAPAVCAPPPQAGRVPTLRALVLGFLGRHVDSLVMQLGPHVARLPADVKACLLCVARRRGVLSNRVLLALADDGWTLMDLAGATALTERALRQVLARCPRLRALDLTGLASPSSALLRDLPHLCPSLELLAVGGCKVQEAAMLEVLPELLPHMQVREQQPDAVQDSWEDVVQGDGAPLPDPGIPCGLQRLKLMVWPSAPPLVQHIIRTVNPRVAIVDALPPHAQGAHGSEECRHASPSSECRLPPSPTAAVAGSGAQACPGEGNRQLGSGSSPVIGSGVLGSGSASGIGSGCYAQPGIQVIRVRKPEGRDAKGPSSSRAHPHQGGRGPAAAGRGGSGGGGGVGRYTAPHLRQQQQQRSQLQPQAGPGLAAGPDEAAPRPARALPQQPELLPPSQRPAAQLHPPPPQQHIHPHLSQQPQLHSHQTHGLAGGRRQLDDFLAALVAGEAWEGLGVSGGAAATEEELHIAEKFRRAYEEQDARLRAKALKEAAAAERYELRTSGAARALAQWLDSE